MIETDVAEAYGLTFQVPARDTAVGACLRDYGEFARPELDLILALCDGDLIDVGANIGAICLPFAKARPQSRVVAIEANPQIAALLSANVAGNGLANVDVLCAAAGEAKGFIEAPAPDLSRAANVGALSLYDAAPRTITTPMVRLDDVAPEATRFVKVDVEGFEDRVLAGAGRLLNGVRPSWLVEVSPQRRETAAAARATLQAAGYRLYWFFSPFLTRKRPRRLDERPKLRGDLSLLAIDGDPPWSTPPVGDGWPKDVSDFPYLSDYGLVGAKSGPTSAAYRSGADREHPE